VNESENIERVVRALATVPPKDLLIIELANRFTKGGDLDYDALAEAQEEVYLAVTEAKMYGAHTLRAVDTLEKLEAIPADVGFGSPSHAE